MESVTEMLDRIVENQLRCKAVEIISRDIGDDWFRSKPINLAPLQITRNSNFIPKKEVLKKKEL